MANSPYVAEAVQGHVQSHGGSVELAGRLWGARSALLGGRHAHGTPHKGHEGVTDEVGTRGASQKRGVSASQMSPVHMMRAGACR